MALAESRPGDWLSLEEVAALSEVLGDRPEMAEGRRSAYRAFLAQPLEPDPLYRKYGYFAGVDLRELNARGSSGPVLVPAVQPGTVHVLHDGSGTRVAIPEELRSAGVAVTTYAELVARAHGTPFDLGSAAPETGDRLTALARLLTNRAVEVHVPDGCPIPVRLKDVTVLSGPHEAISVHRSLRVGAGSRVLATEETFCRPTSGGGQRLVGSTTEVAVGAGAEIAYLSLHAPDHQTVALSQRSASVADHGRITWVWAGLGGFRTRARNTTRLPGNGSSVEDLQAFYGSGRQSYDSGVRIEHIGTDTHGQSITRGVFRDEARGMSRGLVRIEKDARKTISFLSEHAMLLSRGARSDTIPILEILCRDVKATHSTSVAPVDPEKVFYLESRGIASDAAIRMIGEGFLSHVLERAPFAGLRDLLYPYLAARWEGRPLEWTDPDRLALPPLEFTGATSGPDWRFDAKLR